ncbi:MAG: FxsA family protein [Mariprofundaceae bacterium]
MLKLLFALFVVTPLVELYVLIEVGSRIGGVWTILLCLATAAVGGLLIRLQGLMTLWDARLRLARGEIPAEHGLHGAMLVLAGIFLFTPGFITDALGFLLLVPAVRRWLIERMFPPPGGFGGPFADDGIIDAEIIEDIRDPRRLP